MRVLRISHSAAVEEWRGRERALTDLGVDVHLLAAPTEDVGGSMVRLSPRPGEKVRAVRRWGSHPALFVYDPRPLWRALAEHWDVIDVHEEPFALATAEILLLRALHRNRAPYVLYTAQNLRKRYPVPFRWFERAALRGAAGISACNTDAARISQDKGFAGRARVIPLGVDPVRFAADRPGTTTHDDSVRPHRNEDRIVVGFVGRLVPEKGVGVLLDAAALDPRVRLRVAGAGPQLDSLRTAARELGLADRAEFVGPLPPEALPAFYRTLDVLAVPSRATPTWTEQFGRVAVEAMSCGVPVVASDAGALPDVVGGAGLIVAASDASALVSAIQQAAGPRATELRAAGYARAAQSAWDAVGRQYLSLYRSATHAAPPSTPAGVEVIVVAYGRPDLLREALEPIRGLLVTVVDNSSSPEIAALSAEMGARYIDATRNRGFAAGVNVGLANRLAPQADVLLVNPDARITSAQVTQLQDVLRADPALASVAPSQVDEAGRAAQVSWLFPSPSRSWLEALGLSRLRRGPTFVVGSLLLMRREALDQLGGFDERFFLYSEETDWAYRAHLRGWRHAEVPEVVAMHRGAATSTDDLRREAHFHASQERYFRKHFGALGWQITRAAVWTGATARSIVLRDQRGREARRRAALYRLGPVRVEQLRYPLEASS